MNTFTAQTEAGRAAEHREREAKLKWLADRAWELKSRAAFDGVIQVARHMGRTDGMKEASAELDRIFGKSAKAEGR